LQALGDMLLGAHYAGIAIEHAMLGAAHACANPLTARYGTTHGVAIAALLSHVVRWNDSDRYAELSPDLSSRLTHLAEAGALGARVSELGARQADLESLARDAAQQ